MREPRRGRVRRAVPCFTKHRRLGRSGERRTPLAILDRACAVSRHPEPQNPVSARRSSGCEFFSSHPDPVRRRRPAGNQHPVLPASCISKRPTYHSPETGTKVSINRDVRRCSEPTQPTPNPVEGHFSTAAGACLLPLSFSDESVSAHHKMVKRSSIVNHQPVPFDQRKRTSWHDGVPM